MSKSHQHEAQNVHSASVCSKVKIAISLNLGSITDAGGKPGVSCGLLGLCEGTAFVTLHHINPFPAIGIHQRSEDGKCIFKIYS